MDGVNVFCDTNPLIYLLDGNRDVANYIDEKTVWISIITELELFAKKNLKEKEKEEIELLVDSCLVVNINHDIKEIAKDLIQRYAIKLPDAIIAATSIYLDMPLFSADNVYKKIKELKFIFLKL